MSIVLYFPTFPCVPFGLSTALVFSKLMSAPQCGRIPRTKTSVGYSQCRTVAARIITGTRKFDHITPALRDLRWLPVKQKLFFRDAVMAFKCMTGQAPHYLSDQFTTRLAVTGRVTRSCQLLNIPFYKSSTGQRTFYYLKLLNPFLLLNFI